jgi:DNA replication protein DnaC
MKITPLPELTPILKQLRLSGLLDSLDARNREAIEKKLTYPEFLALVIQDEAGRREQKKYGMRLRRADPGINQQLINDLAQCRFIEEKVAVLIAGPCGTGKSHIAQAIGHCAVRLGYDVLFISQSSLLSQINAARATGAIERKMQALIRVPLIIIDDFGLKPLKPGQDEDFHDLIAERYERTATVITSNLDFTEWGEAFPNKLLGASTLDRIRHAAYRLVLDGKSYRMPRGEAEAEQSVVAKAPKTAK